MPLLEFQAEGIYCSAGDFYIDPWKPVRNAVITHGHADHSRWGHGHYLATRLAAPVIRYRLGQDIRLEAAEYGEVIRRNGVSVSFHPAGHIVGSAQVRVAYKGEVWVVSGDYKVEDDGISTPFEVVPCHSFVTESTFGLPVYRWRPQEEVYGEINAWWRQNTGEGKTSVLTAYALGKAQRVLMHADQSIGPVFTHGAVENVNQVIRDQGMPLPPTTKVESHHTARDFRTALVIATPAALGSSWMKKFRPYSTGMASGWMALRGARRRRSADRGFVLSDHADWPGLNQAIRATGAENIYVTHGYTGIFVNWLRENGWNAHEVKTEYEGETDEADKNEPAQ